MRPKSSAAGTTFVLATLETPYFTFTVIDRTKALCTAALRRAWARHARGRLQTGAAFSWALYADGVTYQSMDLGRPQRDGSPI